ncbi:MAG: chemotaxis protein CheD [Halobacteriota archaeon]|nr:chemotaxis protein CheD [Halobacteriota archaeon]
MPKTIKVGIADLKVTQEPNVLTTLGLGSCVGICLWDRVSRIAGLAHIMLPSMSDISKRDTNPMKYADSAIDVILKEMIDLGAKKTRIIAKIAGGAHMFSNVEGNAVKIGDLNVAAVKDKLQEANIKLVAEDTGEDYGRTVELHSTNGKLLVKTAMKGIKEL